MAGFKLINTDVRTLTPELALKFRDMPASPTERNLDPKRVAHLRQKIDNGLAVPFNWATAKLGDALYRMNGQHSSAMLAAMNGEFPEGLKVVMAEYQVDDKDSLALLFRQFDDRKSGRTSGDVAGAYQGLYEDLAGIDRAIAKLAMEGISWWRDKVEGLPVTRGDDQYDRFNNPNYREFVIWAANLLSIKTPELKRQAVIAAMYATHSVNPDAATEFWTMVGRGGVETEDADPTTVLDGWLRETKEDAKLRDKLKPAHFYQGCIFAWNAWREDKSLKDIRFDTKKGLHTPTA